MRRSRNWHQAGFTFIEILFVIVLMAMVYAVALPNLNILDSSAISSKLSRLTSDIRGAFDLAVLSQKPYRIVFMLQSGDYWLETTDSQDFSLGDHVLGRDLTAEEEKEQLEAFEVEFGEYEEAAGSAIEDSANERVIQPESPVVKAKDKLKPTVWTKVESAEWGKRSIGDELIFQDIHALHHDRKQTFEERGEEARAIIYFFPSGYVEPAVLHVAFRKGSHEFDETEAPYTLVTNPYEGVAELISGYEEIDFYERFDKK